jgi:uncharacterized protein (TIGR01777 family)
MVAKKLVIAGGSGFLGHLLASWFDQLGWKVVCLTRDPASNVEPARRVLWDGHTLDRWAIELDGAEAVVNLAGQSVNCRYHARNRAAILNSRIDSTRVISLAVAACQRPPKVWLNSSTATIYKHSFVQAMDERNGVIEGTPAEKDEFSVDVARAWERAFDEARTPQTRKVALRTAMVFGTHPGTVYRVLRRLASWGLGGAMAGGRQYVSWLHEADFCRAVQWLIERPGFSGVVNLASPYPVTNREMMRVIRHTCGVPLGLPASRWMLEIGTWLLRSESELVIKSRRVIPARLTEAGFAFWFPEMAGAIANLEARLTQGGRTTPESFDTLRTPGSQRAPTLASALESTGRPN